MCAEFGGTVFKPLVGGMNCLPCSLYYHKLDFFDDIIFLTSDWNCIQRLFQDWILLLDTPMLLTQKM